MSARRVANVVAGVFLVVVAALVAYGVRELVSGPEKLATEPLVEDLTEFVVPVGAASSPVVVTECTGEGSFPAYAERSLDVDGDAAEVAAALRKQAIDLGWVPGASEFGSDFERGSHVLSIDEPVPSAEASTVVLHVATDTTC